MWGWHWHVTPSGMLKHVHTDPLLPSSGFLHGEGKLGGPRLHWRTINRLVSSFSLLSGNIRLWCHVHVLVPPSNILILYLFIYFYSTTREPGDSVIKVSGYGLDDRAIQVRSPAETKGLLSSLCVQAASGAYPISCTVGTGCPFPGGKARPGRDSGHSPASGAEVENE
jgi:hypothetical protein